MFFGWIMGLATLAAVVYPFSTGAPLAQKGATGVVNLVLGLAITSLLTAVSSRAIRRPVPPPAYGDGPGYGRDQRDYGPQQGPYAPEQAYPPEQNYPPEPRRPRPTQPIHVAPNRDPRR